MKTAIELIAEERKRQIDAEGWTPTHDDTHTRGELALAASCYSKYAAELAKGSGPLFAYDRAIRDWPFEPRWFKPSHYIVRNLEKAGALIAAEIDRLNRREVARNKEQIGK